VKDDDVFNFMVRPRETEEKPIIAGQNAETY